MYILDYTLTLAPHPPGYIVTGGLAWLHWVTLTYWPPTWSLQLCCINRMGYTSHHWQRFGCNAQMGYITNMAPSIVNRRCMCKVGYIHSMATSGLLQLFGHIINGLFQFLDDAPQLLRLVQGNESESFLNAA